MMISPLDLQQDTSRGLYKDEVMEVMWMVYPPKATGFDPAKRSQWMKKAGGDRVHNFFGGRCLMSEMNEITFLVFNIL